MSELNSSLLPGAAGDVSHAAAAGAEIGHLAAESQLSSAADIAAARHFFQPTANMGMPTPGFTGAEATAVAGKAAVAATGGAEASAVSAAAKSIASIASTAGAEAAAFGSHALSAGAAAAAAEVSPMIQLIMRLPGLGGVAQSFFEWLGALFAAPSHLAEVFDPNMWAHLGSSLQSSLANLGTHGIGAEHFNVSLSMLPTNAPFLQQLSMQAGTHFSDLRHISSSMSNTLGSGGSSGLSLQNQFNISGPLDLKKAQFEFGQPGAHSGLHLEGKMSGPQLNNDFNSSSLSGTQRLFSDQISRPSSLLAQSNTGAANNIVSNANTPAGNAGSSLNISSNAFGQNAGSMPANFSASDGIISGPSVSNNIGYQLSDSAGSTFDKAPSLAPSGRVSDTLGGSKDLLASNEVPGGSYFKPAGMPSTDAAAGASTDSGMTGLKAEPMSLLKKAPTLGKVPDKGAIDYIGHQSKGLHHAATNTAAPASNPTSTASSQPAMDQISHRGAHAGAEHATKQIAYKHVSGDSAASHAHTPEELSKPVAHAKPHSAPVHHAKPHIERAAAQPARPAAEAQYQQQAIDQQGATTDQTAMNEAGTDRVASSYTVQRGDNLWDIARKNLGDGSRWQEIYKLNENLIGSNPDLIHSGLDLKLPGSDATQISDAGGYTVQPGDNLWDIAKDKLGDGSRWGEIYDVNKSIIGENPRLIFSGTHLEMPGAEQAISQAAPMQAAPIQAVPQMDPQAMAPQQMAPQQMAPQAMAPQQNSYFQSMQGQQNLSGPGAAAAATLDPTQAPVQSGPVSPSLAPDLSFLYNNGKSQ